MQIQNQITAFLENKPGRLSKICSALAKEKISIQALTVMDSKEHSVLRLVVDDVERAADVLQKLGAHFSVTDVVVVELKHQPGAIANMCDRLASEHVNIDYIYCSAASKNGKATAVLKATPINKVKAVLGESAAPKASRPLRRKPPARK